MQFKNKYLIALIPIIFIFGAVYYFLDIFTYIMLAWVFSMIGTPLMRLFRKIFSKTISALLTLSSFALFLILIIWLFVPPLYEQARNLSGVDYSKVVQSLEEPVKDWTGWLSNKGLVSQDSTDAKLVKNKLNENERPEQFIQIDTALTNIDSTTTHVSITLNINDLDQPKELKDAKNKSLFESYRKNIYNVLDPSTIPKIFSSIVGFLGNFLITILSIFFISFFFLKEQGLFSTMIKTIVPNEHEDRVSKMLDASSNLLIRYFIGIALQIIVITLFVSLILGLFHIKNALLIGFFAALMNVIPYLGPIIGATFGTLITISSNLNESFYDVLLPQIIVIAIVFLIVQLIDNFILQPTIFSKSVKAHPLEIFIVVLLGAKIGGVIGMIVAIPTYTVLRVIAKVFLGEFKIVQKITEGI